MSKDVKNKIVATLLMSACLTVPTLSQSQDISDLPELSPIEAQQESELDINEVLKEIDEAVPEVAPAQPDIIEVSPQPVKEKVVEPQGTELMDPQDANTQAAIEQAGNVPDIPDIASENEPDDSLFFDAEALVPQGELARKGAPRRVSPATEPGSRLILVEKSHAAGSKKAEMVAAERAMKLGRYASALEMYEAMYASNKRDPNVLMGRAEAYQRLGQDDFAVQAYEELLDIRPSNLEARINMLGIISKRYPAVALRQLMDLREKHSDNIGIVAQIAVAQAKLERYQDAIRYLGIAASMEPQNPSHVFNMAVIADRAGSKQEAIKFYEEALEIDTLYGKGGAIPRESVFERLAALR